MLHAELAFPHETLLVSTILASRIPTLLIASAKVLDQMLAGPQCKRQDRNCGGLVRAKREHAGVAHIEIRDVMGLTKPVRDKCLRIVAKPTNAGFMEAVASPFRLISHTQSSRW